MNINKLIATGILLFILLVPFRYIYLDDTRIISTGAQMLIFLVSLFGFLFAFWVGTNEPFGKNKRRSNQAVASDEQAHRKAA